VKETVRKQNRRNWT